MKNRLCHATCAMLGQVTQQSTACSKTVHVFMMLRNCSYLFFSNSQDCASSHMGGSRRVDRGRSYFERGGEGLAKMGI